MGKVIIIAFVFIFRNDKMFDVPHQNNTETPVVADLKLQEKNLLRHFINTDVLGVAASQERISIGRVAHTGKVPRGCIVAVRHSVVTQVRGQFIVFAREQGCCKENPLKCYSRSFEFQTDGIWVGSSPYEARAVHCNNDDRKQSNRQFDRRSVLRS